MTVALVGHVGSRGWRRQEVQEKAGRGAQNRPGSAREVGDMTVKLSGHHGKMSRWVCTGQPESLCWSIMLYSTPLSMVECGNEAVIARMEQKRCEGARNQPK